MLEAVKRPLEDVFEAAAKAEALAIGPGLGRGDEAKALVRRLLAEVELPAVVDADALFELEPGEWPAPRVLTPHEGELGRLLGRESKEIAAHRLASVQEAAETFNAVVVLKGEDSLVAAPGRGVLVCALGLPSLATAGTGDVLTGVTAAFLAKGMEPQRAAAAACAAQQLASRDGRAALRPRRERRGRGAAVSSRRVAGRPARSPREPGGSRVGWSAPASRARRGAGRGRGRPSPPS